MSKILQVEKMSVEEKIQIMESIWDDLSKNSENITSPSWHEKILKERENDEIIDWETAKKNIQNSVS